MNFEEVEAVNQISKEKRKDILKLLEKHYGDNWRSLPSLSFFVYLLDVAIEFDGEGQLDLEQAVDVPECVHIEENTDLIV